MGRKDFFSPALFTMVALLAMFAWREVGHGPKTKPALLPSNGQIAQKRGPQVRIVLREEFAEDQNDLASAFQFLLLNNGANLPGPTPDLPAVAVQAKQRQ
jgi:hypothetical protein